MQDWEQELLEVAKDYNVITFDVFDTLLIRDVLKPIDVFWLVGGNVFRYRRIMAEYLANMSSKKEEITIQDIYKFLPQKYMEQEINVEKAVCRANPSVERVYHELKKAGKRIFAISDMYLSKNVVSELLHSAGYSFEDIYVSSEYGVRKQSGKLFEVFCQKEEINREDILHIGDNPDADGKGSDLAGISSFLVPEIKNSLRYSRKKKHLFYLVYNEKKKRILQMRGFINHGLTELNNSCEKLGYEILGPILVSFVQWIYNRKNEYGFSKLFFLARDMKIVHDIYQEIYGKDDCAYFHISRAAIRNMSRESTPFFYDYIKKMGCHGNVAIVDTGWKGFTQKVIGEYAKHIDIQTDIGGLYMGKSASMKWFSPFNRTEACFINKGKKCRQAPIYCGLLESFIGSNEEQVVNYRKGGTLVFNSILRRSKKFDDLQRGALKFAKQWKYYGNIPIDRAEAFSAFYYIFDKPFMEDIRLLGTCETDHFIDAKLIVFKSKQYYLKHWKDWFIDLRLSTWKGAFFKLSFLHHRLIYSLYKYADSLLIMFKDKKKLKNKSLHTLMQDYY